VLKLTGSYDQPFQSYTQPQHQQLLPLLLQCYPDEVACYPKQHQQQQHPSQHVLPLILL
jgi:hypothetical protein